MCLALVTKTMSDCGDDWIYRFDDVLVAPHAHRLERAGKDIAVEPKAYKVLVALLEQAGDVVDKDALLDAGWGHRHVTPGVLSRVVAQLRHALGDSAGKPRYIATVHSLGYRFIGNVQRDVARPASAESASLDAIDATDATTPADTETAAAAPAAAHQLHARRLIDRRSPFDRRASLPRILRRFAAYGWGVACLLILALALLLAPPLLHL